MGWLFPLLVWDTPSSPTCEKGPAHLENSKMRRLAKKMNVIMHFFVDVSLGWVSYLEINLNYT